uniref:SMP-LTD domain-containing protein n=1 Tax=Panagrolaimus sp. PS1159 TaxID=55785 RepID=A0AC35GYH3_9BILA
MTEIIEDNIEAKTDNKIIQCKDSGEIIVNNSAEEEDDSQQAAMAFNGVRFSRTNSECSINNQKETTSGSNNSYWTINDDEVNVEVDAGVEADESSIASSMKETNSSYPFLRETSPEQQQQQNQRQLEVMAEARGRSASSVSKSSITSFLSKKGTNVSRAGSMVRETTQVIVDDPNMTYKVIATKEKLTLDNAFPSLDDAKTLLPTSLDELPAIKDLSLDKITQLLREIAFRYQRLPFFRYRLFTLACLSIIYFILPGFITGLLFGLYLSIIAFLFVCVSDPIIPGTLSQQQFQHVVDEVADYSKKEEATPKVYKGWMNILNEAYNPHTFHVNHIQTVLVRLDGNMLRISRPERSVLKHAFYDDPSLNNAEPRMMAQSIYDLTNASVKLRPKRLAKRRWFSRKYPICIRLASPDNEIHSRNEDRWQMQHSKTMNTIAKDSDNESTSSAGPLTKLFRRKKKRSRKPSEMSHDSNASGKDSEVQSAHNVDAISTQSADAKIASSDDIVMGKEADGYISDLDLSNESDGDIVGVHRSFSATDLNRTSVIKLQKNFPGSKTRAFRNIYLFGRSAREKERWFHVLRKACNKYTEAKTRNLRKTSLPSPSSSTSNGMSRDYFLYLMDHLQFSKHLEEILLKPLDQRTNEEKAECGTIFMDLGRQKWQKPAISNSSEFVIFANLMTMRLFYDFCRDEFFCSLVKDKIQNKLASIHLPYFIESLELSKFEIGTKIPKIQKIYAPVVDDWGIWVDFEIHYEGCIRLVLETKADLMKLKENPDPTEGGEKNATSCLTITKALSRYSHESVAESPETSPDEDYGSKVKYHDLSTKEKTGQKILNLVDKVAHSKIFKAATNMKPIKKAMEEVSSTRLVLNVEITSLEGTLALNLPPPPSDRLWYAFRSPPTMSVKAVPQVGDRSVAFSTVSDWIVSKIRLVLEKNLVVPNMDDIRIPVLGGNALLNAPLNQ